MTLLRIVTGLAALALAATAHPMGNFSVNHYSRLRLRASGVELTYVLDLAEIPTFQVMRSGNGPQAQEWISNLPLVQNGKRITWHIKSVTPKTTDGAGGMPTLRIVIVATAELRSGEVSYEDLNFPGRAGWKEIVIDHGDGARDLSAALTHYPTDPSVAPPQDLAAHMTWTPEAPVAHALLRAGSSLVSTSHAPTRVSAQQTESLRHETSSSLLVDERSVMAAAPPAPSFIQQQPTAPGSVVRGDFLSRMLQRRDLGLGLIALCVLAAFGLGATHALSPGHGKTIVAAYLVGSRGTLKHAGLLGFVVTFTHTFTVFLLGLGVLFFQQYVVPEKIVPALGAISGLSIVLVGAWLLYKRSKALLPSHHHHHHSHDHHGHNHSHTHTHTHGGSTHSHTIPGQITPAGLVALGVSGGLVPCPSALILMLSAIALGRPGLGLVLLVAFSSGLALVLMTIGALALYARHLLPDSKKTSQHPVFRLIPVFSAVVVICLGLAITAISAGWVRPMLFLS
jgi:ABC-type nickel/cobalt efflux system permease component RcnA